MKAIVACDFNNGIGYKNELLYMSIEDMRWFSSVTKDYPMIMGYNTFISLPRVLPRRPHIVFTNKLEVPEVIDKISYTIARYNQQSDVYVVNSLSDFDQLCKEFGIVQQDCTVIGGQQIYKLFEDRINIIYKTVIHHNFENVDTYFPIDTSGWLETWNESSRPCGELKLHTEFKVLQRP